MRRSAIRVVAFIMAAPLCGGAAAFGQSCLPYWRSVERPPSPWYANHLVHFDDGSSPALYTGWGTQFSNMVRWRDDQWEVIEAGLPPDRFNVGSPFILDDGNGPALYTYLQLPLSQRWIGRWDGQRWNEAFPGMAHAARAPAISVDIGDGMKIYGVQFDTATTDPAILRWDTDSWTVIGSGALRLYNLDLGDGDGLYGMGWIEIGGSMRRTIARWDGTEWVDLGSPGYIVDLGRDSVVFDDGSGPALYTVTDIWRSGEPHHALRRWLGPGPDGGWEIVGATTAGPGIIAYYTRLHVFDDGRGPALYMGGQFHDINGVRAICIARYDGENWEALGAGLRGVVPAPSAMASIETSRGPALMVSGDFETAGGGQARRLAMWVGCPNCYANCDGRTIEPRLTVDDFTCFIDKFAQQDPYANCTGADDPPYFTVDDFTCFINRFAQGCE